MANRIIVKPYFRNGKLVSGYTMLIDIDERGCNISKSRYHKNIPQESRDKIAKAKFGVLRSEKTRRRVSETLVGRRFSEDEWKFKESIKKLIPGKCECCSKPLKCGRSKLCKLCAGKQLGFKNKGRIVTEETRKKISEIEKGHLFYGPKRHSTESRSKMSKARKGKVWSDDHRKKAMRANNKRPNKAEQILFDICKELFPGEYALNVKANVIMIGGKIPDIVNINVKKKLIELFGRYWHTWRVKCDSYKAESDRTEYFKRFGWDTLVIWDEELKNPEVLKIKLREFHNKV